MNYTTLSLKLNLKYFIKKIYGIPFSVVLENLKKGLVLPIHLVSGNPLHPKVS